MDYELDGKCPDPHPYDDMATSGSMTRTVILSRPRRRQVPRLRMGDCSSWRLGLFRRLRFLLSVRRRVVFDRSRWFRQHGFIWWQLDEE